MLDRALLSLPVLRIVLYIGKRVPPLQNAEGPRVMTRRSAAAAGVVIDKKVPDALLERHILL